MAVPSECVRRTVSEQYCPELDIDNAIISFAAATVS